MRNFFALDGPFSRFMNTLGNIIWTGLLWLVFSLPVFTMGCAACGAFRAVKVGIREQKSYITREFLAGFKESWKTALGVQVFTILFFAWILFDCIYLFGYEAEYAMVISYVLYGVFAAALGISFFYYPCLMTFEGNFFEIFKIAVYMTFRHLITTIVLVGLFLASLTGIYLMPWSILLLPGLWWYAGGILIERAIKKETDLLEPGDNDPEFTENEKGMGDEMEKDMTLALEDGMVNRGNWERIKKIMRRAAKGDKLTIAFLGGSITQGCLSSIPEKCYAYLTYLWWKQKYPEAQFSYVNAGIGGTTSQFGAARVEQDVLQSEPDLVFVEFSVNDENTEFFKETYEGLLRHIYGAEGKPAVMLIHNIKYDDGMTAEEIHKALGEYYQIPCVSMQSTIYAKMKAGGFTSRDVTEDDLHPNDTGHRMLADVITYYLEQIDKERELEEENVRMPAPVTANAYEHSYRYQSKDIAPVMEGFLPDTREKEYYTDIFKGGWSAEKEGAEIRFKLEGSGIAVQFRQSVAKPAPVAKAVVDGDEEHAVILDANFDEDWGDNLALKPVLIHGENSTHELVITITEAHEEDAADFYLTSVIASR